MDYIHIRLASQIELKFSDCGSCIFFTLTLTSKAAFSISGLTSKPLSHIVGTMYQQTVLYNVMGFSLVLSMPLYASV